MHVWARRLRHRILDLDETLPYEEDVEDEEVGIAPLFDTPDAVPTAPEPEPVVSTQMQTAEPPIVATRSDPLDDIAGLSGPPFVVTTEDPFDDTSGPDSEPALSDREMIQVDMPLSQPGRGGRVRRKPKHLRDYYM